MFLIITPILLSYIINLNKYINIAKIIYNVVLMLIYQPESHNRSLSTYETKNSFDYHYNRNLESQSPIFVRLISLIFTRFHIVDYVDNLPHQSLFSLPRPSAVRTGSIQIPFPRFQDTSVP